MRPTAHGFSGADADPNADVGYRRPPISNTVAQYSTRSSASAAACACAGSQRAGHLLDAHRAIARRSARPGDEYTIRRRLSVLPPLRGRRPRSSYTISALIPMRLPLPGARRPVLYRQPTIARSPNSVAASLGPGISWSTGLKAAA